MTGDADPPPTMLKIRRPPAAARSIAPFVGASVVAWVATMFASGVDWIEWGVALVVALLAGVLAVCAVLRAPRAAIPAGLVYLAAAALLGDAAGGLSSGVGALAVIPVFAIALLSRSRRDLAVVLLGQALFYAVPILAIGGRGYPSSQLRVGLLAVIVSALVGSTTQRLVERVRGEAQRARGRERMHETVTQAIHTLFDSDSARADVCASVRQIGEANVAAVYEQVGTELVCTAADGLDISERLVAAPESLTAEAFASGRPSLIDVDAAHRAACGELWEAAGRPSSVLYQPLHRDGRALGVLVVGWPDRVRADGPRYTVVALLAQQAASVIARADALVELAGEANTDPLTGLPNRRVWDAELARALGSSRPLSVAMLDLDHFKAYNDRFGHPAGDELLRETTAAWREQLRPGDVLARLGGEEFGLLLCDGDRASAVEVVHRLRDYVGEGETCSAGIAQRRPGESAGRLVARADAALYEAKAAGRDCVRVADASLAPAQVDA